MLCHAMRLVLIERKMHKINEEINNSIVWLRRGRSGRTGILCGHQQLSLLRIASLINMMLGNKLTLLFLSLSLSLATCLLSDKFMESFPDEETPPCLVAINSPPLLDSRTQKCFEGGRHSLWGHCDLASIKWNVNVNSRKRF